MKDALYELLSIRQKLINLDLPKYEELNDIATKLNGAFLLIDESVDQLKGIMRYYA